MKIVRCIRNTEYEGNIPKITWWLNKCDQFIFNEYNYIGFVMFADVDDDIYNQWVESGTFINGNITNCPIPSTGVNGISISITEDDNYTYLENKEILEVESFEDFRFQCIIRGMNMSDRDETPNIGWMAI